MADEKETKRKPRVRRPRRRKKDEAETPKAAEATTEDAADETAEAAEEKPAAKGRAKATKAAKTEKPKAEEKADAKAEADTDAKAEPDTEAAEADDEGEEAPPAKTKLPAGEKRPSKPRRGAAETAAPKTKPKTKPKSRRGGDAPADVEVRARAAYVRCAPRKARLVVDHIRGKSVEEARAILTHTPRAASRDVLKLLNSAVANAESNHELLADELRVHRVFVDEGPTLKRYRPRALGRATRVRKRTSHMTITLKPELAETKGKGKE